VARGGTRWHSVARGSMRWHAVSRVSLVNFLVLEIYEEAWTVKYENIVKYFKKRKIMNATDVAEDVAVLEKVKSLKPQ
jgi:hypothetical protein